MSLSELLHERAPGTNPLRVARLLHGLSQRELEEQAGLPRTAISHFEAGRRRPDGRQQAAIADALGVNASELFPPWGHSPP